MNTNLKTIKNTNKIIPIFFAVDSNYLPFLSVSLQSLIENANNENYYNIYILHTGIKEEETLPILNFCTNYINIKFVNIESKLEEVKDRLQLRDYYTGSTYYRIFIADMFLEYDKAIYLDSDTIVLGDISKLYNYDLKNNLVGAVTDKVVNSNNTFKKYSLEVLGIDPKHYFNAGVLLMNLKKFREDNFYSQFQKLLKEYKFIIAQDQDYLNVLCKDKVKFLPASWNIMPIDKTSKSLNLIHYNLTLKPWHYLDIPYANYFWEYCNKNHYQNIIKQTLLNYSNEEKENDKVIEKNLIELAKKEINREDNFLKLQIKKDQIYLESFIQDLFSEDINLDFIDDTFYKFGVM